MHNSSLESLDPGKEFRKESSNAVRDLATVDEAREDLQMMDSFYASNPGQTSPMSVALPLLPKPLTVLKTAETRTYLSKLIWLGNGGRRPQYGNPDTKPIWWPQHLLPWEDMKKMGGKKSEELSHINYTEILKQCLAAGYEYLVTTPPPISLATLTPMATTRCWLTRLTSPRTEAATTRPTISMRARPGSLEVQGKGRRRSRPWRSISMRKLLPMAGCP